NLRLLMMLVADGAAPVNRQQTASTDTKPTTPGTQPQTPTTTQTTTTRSTQQQTSSQPTQRTANDPPAPRKNPLSEAEIGTVLGKQIGSKALKIEVDDAPGEHVHEVVTVMDRREQRDATPGTIAVEVKFNHQP